MVVVLSVPYRPTRCKKQQLISVLGSMTPSMLCCSCDDDTMVRTLNVGKLVANLNAMQQNVLQLISDVSDKAASEDMAAAEKIAEELHQVEVTFVKMLSLIHI